MIYYGRVVKDGIIEFIGEPPPWPSGTEVLIEPVQDKPETGSANEESESKPPKNE